MFFLLMTASISELSKHKQYKGMMIRKWRNNVLGEEILSREIEDLDLLFSSTTVTKAKKV